MPARDLPKYAIPEIERRWLADRDAAGDLAGLPCIEIEDCYIEGSRLRLRRMAWPQAAPVYKLCKKYGRRTELSEAITNLYLSPEEHALLARLPGRRVRKRRYPLLGGSLDVYETPREGLCIFEREFTTERAAGNYQPPVFAMREITGDSSYSGAALAGALP